MVSTKTIGHYLATLSLCLFLLMLLSTGLTAADGDWTTLTSFRDVRRLLVIDDALYAATSGGLLIIDNPDQPGRQFLNTDGLGTIDISDVMVDADGQTWLATFGRLIKFEPDDPQQFLFRPTDADLFLLTALEDDGDNLWVGTDTGLVLFSKINDGGQIEGHFPLTTINSFPSVYDVAVDGDQVWVATSFGLVAADKSGSGSLFPPSAWTHFTVSDYPELGSDTITAVAAFDSELYIGTSQGLFQLDISDSDTSFSLASIAAGRRVYDLVTENDSLFVYFSSGMGVVVSGMATVLSTVGLPSLPVTGTTWRGERWVNVTGGGIYTDRSGNWEEYQHTGLPGDFVTRVAIDGEGQIIIGHGPELFAKYARFNGEIWEDANTGTHELTTSLITDSSGIVWGGTKGHGLWRFDGDSLARYDNNNSTCVGIPAGHNFSVVNGVATDGVRIYASCFLAYNNAPVAFCPLDRLDDPSAWGSFGETEGLTDNLVTGLGCSPQQLAVGTQGSGVYLCDLSNEPDGSISADCIQYTRENSPLISNTINIITYSPTGDAWVGTNFGLSRWDFGTEQFVDVNLPVGIGSDITALTFDGRGNLWIGTGSGLAYREAGTGYVVAYTVINSDLVSNGISDLALDGTTGDLYIATDAGLSILEPQIRHRTTVLNSVVPVPNPFVIRSDDDRLEFNYNRPGTVCLFTVAGEAVVEFQVNSSWDGRNHDGRKVASGVYLFILTDDNGGIAQGKVLVVRER
ncbi:MAG: hypothetical protein KOO62_02905 [candidate division Zixibacteria bacterium]|nr:hypothetical protein [candidate division Zixibacteria bacterium]